MECWPFSWKKLKALWRTLSSLLRILLERNQHLEKELKALQQEVQILKESQAQNSRNSHQPPSRDGLKKPKPKPRSLRQKSGRKPGGQPGHPGQTLQPVQEPDQIEIHPLESCPQCGGVAIKREPVMDYEARQVFDLPPRTLEVTEHRAPIKHCPECGHLGKATFPDQVKAPTQYGQRFLGLLVYLSQGQLIPFNRVAQMCEDLFGQPLSTASVVAANQQAYQHLEPFAHEVARQIAQADLAHFDESGMRVAAKLHWLHVASTPTLTSYGVHPKRGREAMDALGIVGECRGWTMHDYWKPYFGYEQCLHAVCNGHLLRELKFLWEEEKEPWAKELSDLLLELHQKRNRDGEFSEPKFKRALKAFRAIVRRGRLRHPRVRSPKHLAQGKAANLLDRLQAYDWNILAFLLDERVPFTNNQGEQDIRMIKLQQKISGCFRTLEGAQVFCRIRSYLSTCRKQGQDIWRSLQMAIAGRPFIPVPLC